MRITWLLDRVDQPSREVSAALADADWLAARGHDVTVLCCSGPPAAAPRRCALRQVPDFGPAHVPDSDVVLGTASTVPFAARAGRGLPVRVWSADGSDATGAHDEGAVRLSGVQHVCALRHQRDRLRQRSGVQAHEVGCAIDPAVHHPAPERAPGAPVRVGLVGGGRDADPATAIEACRLASAAGLDLQLVRVTGRRDGADGAQPFPVEWHEGVPPEETGAILRSLDVFLGTARGDDADVLPAIEAMACGVPCVFTDAPCFRGLGDGRHALFVPARDPAAMAEALVVAGRLDQVRAALRSNGIAAAARWSQDEHGRALERALHAIVAPATPAAAALSDPGTADDPGRQLASSLCEVAARLLRQGNPGRAGDFYAAAHCLDRDARSAGEAAWCRHLAGDTTGALTAFGALVAAGLDDVRAHERHGLLLYGTGRAAEAAQAFRAAIAAGGRSAGAYNNLGVVLYQAGDPAGARRSFERALTLEPDHPDAQANLQAMPA